MKNIEYKFYDEALLRIPYYPYNQYKYINCIDSIISLKSFKEAIYISSPSLYHEIYVKKDRSERTILSLVKYYIRACTRCTPYGLFAGCSTVQMKEESYVKIATESEYTTYTRIDMEYLCQIIRLLEHDPDLKTKLKFYTNTTLYHIGNSVRYIEYTMNKSKRKYTFSEVKLSDYLDCIIKSASSHPQTIYELASKIISDEISESEAVEFVYELIGSQILMSELEPAIAGEDLIIQLKYKLIKLGYNNLFVDDIISLLLQSDKTPIGQREYIYEKIKKLLSNQYSFDKDNLLHVDCGISIVNSSIGQSVRNAVLKGIKVISELTPIAENEMMSVFIKAFQTRYENQEIPLVIALDTQVGIGFGKWNELQGDINPLIDDLFIPNATEPVSMLKNDKVTQLLIYKYEECLKNGTQLINITNEDLQLFSKENRGDLPEYLFTMIKVLDFNEDKSEAVIIMDSASGGSPVNLFSRFEYLDSKINKLVNRITEAEEKYYSNKIIAEILHLPEDRVGNIQMHPQNRKYCINYMSNPSEISSKKLAIPIEDIMISVQNGKNIILRSKKYNKEIIPRLSTAHNFMNGLPIYSFLCNLQHYNKRKLFFNWGSYFNAKPFLPRVVYENIILSPAQWLVSYWDIPEQSKESFDEFYPRFIEWKESKKLPNLIQIAEYDNKLFIDFTNKLLVKLFISTLKKKRQCILEEFLFLDLKNPLVKRERTFFTNELVLCLYKEW